MASRIKLTFLDSNPAGANDNDGFKIYRDVGTDPCPAVDASGNTVANPATLVYTSAPADITAGTGYVDWEDSDVVGGTPYHYRASFTRGSEESFSLEVGPVEVASINDLGYPNGSPSHTSGVANYVTTEPILHFDARAEWLKHGAGYVYSNGEHFINRAPTYSVPGSGFGDVGATSNASYSKSVIEYTGTDTSRPTVPVVGELPTNTANWNGANFTGTNGYMDSLQFRALLMDEGVTSFSVVAPSLTGDGAGNAYRLGMPHTQVNNSHYYLTAPGYNNWTTFSYTDPRNSDFKVRYWSNRTVDHYVNLEDHFNTTEYDTFKAYPGLGVSIGYTAVAKDNIWSDANALSTPELRESDIAGGVQNDLSIVVSNIKPDGRQRVWVNGVLLHDRSVMQNVGINAGIQPLPLLTKYIGWGVYQMTKAEQLFFPKSLDAAEFQMVTAYLESRYATWLYPQAPYSNIFA